MKTGSEPSQARSAYRLRIGLAVAAVIVSVTAALWAAATPDAGHGRSATVIVASAIAAIALVNAIVVIRRARRVNSRGTDGR